MDVNSGGCCISRYNGSEGPDLSKMNMIMLRFRPIAPKPVTSGSGSGGSPPHKPDVPSKTGRGKKRTYVKDTGNSNVSSKRCNKKINPSPENQVRTVVTLSLLPETPERKDFPARSSPPEKKEVITNAPIWLNFNNFNNNNNKYSARSILNYYDLVRYGPYAFCVPGGGSSDRKVVMTGVTGSCVIVECVTETWINGDGLGSTDVDRRRNLYVDTCPGFISDGYGRVTWTNKSYRKMVGQGGDEDDDQIRVWLVINEKLPVTIGGLLYPAFSCRVRLKYACGKERVSIALPCDVWRMDGGGGGGGGGLAWRLDTKTALSLGR